MSFGARNALAAIYQLPRLPLHSPQYRKRITIEPLGFQVTGDSGELDAETGQIEKALENLKQAEGTYLEIWV